MTIPQTYECIVCHEIFSVDDPCPHTEELRQQNIEHFERDNQPDDPIVVERSIWGIAKRLTFSNHMR